MRVLYINNDGGGFADYIDVTEGMTVEQFFNEKMPDRKSDDYLIRVNRQPVPRDCILQENDRVTITPTKVEGGKV
ncbi:MAG: MoaD/ThiS family protein [Planctomycetota bacterium]|jgi:sulfur carrier protein ThiS